MSRDATDNQKKGSTIRAKGEECRRFTPFFLQRSPDRTCPASPVASNRPGSGYAACGPPPAGRENESPIYPSRLETRQWAWKGAPAIQHTKRWRDKAFREKSCSFTLNALSPVECSPAAVKSILATAREPCCSNGNWINLFNVFSCFVFMHPSLSALMELNSSCSRVPFRLRIGIEKKKLFNKMFRFKWKVCRFSKRGRCEPSAATLVTQPISSQV